MSRPPTFLAYRRDVGRPGVRNHLLVLNVTGLTGPSARAVAGSLRGSRLVSMPHGTPMSTAHGRQVDETLLSLARHPNAGAVLILSADDARSARFAEALADAGKPVEAVTLGACGRDALTLRDRATRRGAGLLAGISRQQREPVPWSELMVALECGMSDPSSGLGANPLLGAFVDRLTAAGGAAVFGETMEWLGSEERLAERAVTPEVAAAIRHAVARRERAATEGGIDLLGNNPNKANIDGGLTTIEDKAIGSVAKSGTGPVAAMLAYGDRFEGRGLAAMDQPSYTPESLTGLVAAGAQVCLFTSGLGNSYVSMMAPTVKITANAGAAERLSTHFDFTCADVMARPERREAAVDALTARVLEVASGAMTFGEILKEEDEVPSRFGETL